MPHAKFDRSTMSMSDLKKQPIAVVETELAAFSKVLGIKPSELFRSLNPGAAIDSDVANVVADCCHSDSW